MIQMGSNMLEISRDIYTFLDLLSDIGGIQGIFISFGAFFFAYWEQNQLENYMVSHLYWIKNR